MDERMMRFYKSFRHKGFTAKSALEQARLKRRVEDMNIRWVDTPMGSETIALWRDGEYLLAVHVTPNEDPIPIGEFTDKWSPRAVDLHTTDRREYRYFVPEVTEDEQYRGLRRLKWGKTAAREAAHRYLLEDLKIAREGEEQFVFDVRIYRTDVDPEDLDCYEVARHEIPGEEVFRSILCGCPRDDEYLVTYAEDVLLEVTG